MFGISSVLVSVVSFVFFVIVTVFFRLSVALVRLGCMSTTFVPVPGRITLPFRFAMLIVLKNTSGRRSLVRLVVSVTVSVVLASRLFYRTTWLTLTPTD